jgi:L-lactate permease
VNWKSPSNPRTKRRKTPDRPEEVGPSSTLRLLASRTLAAVFTRYRLVGSVPHWIGHSSAALFGKLQQVTAGAIGINPVLATSANLAGAVMGKLISPQSIAVACAATGLIGRETDIFRSTAKYSVILLFIIAILILLQAYVFPGMVTQELAGIVGLHA